MRREGVHGRRRLGTTGTVVGGRFDVKVQQGKKEKDVGFTDGTDPWAKSTGHKVGASFQMDSLTEGPPGTKTGLE